ncbi:MAG: beta-ketoacyl synthase chain length factor [Sediminibacterium sp.]
MKIYIQTTAAISPQKTFGQVSFLTEPVAYTGNRLKTIEPDYTNLIDAKLLRRMSRIIKMGVATGTACLQEAGENNPGAIVTGTAYGCLEDTATFLTHTIQRNEEMPPPTAFIQSTHNTVGAQIALILKCHNYNNTFVHDGFSFESALLDAVLLLKEKEADNVLVGSIDELTDDSYAVLSRAGLYKRNLVSSLDIYTAHSKGTIAGEGAAFFLLTNKNTTGAYAQLDGMTTFYKPRDVKEIEQQIVSFLTAHSINTNDIGLVITGKNGDAGEDEIYEQLQQTIFHNNQLIQYKNLSGEYPTSASFALWMAANMLKTGTVPAVTGYQGSKEDKLTRMLIYNHYRHTHHSLVLVSACE